MYNLPSSIRLLLYVLLAQRRSTSLALDVTWTRPAAGDVYSPGSYIIGEWWSDRAILMPSFRLCNDQAEADGFGASGEDDAGCGIAIQPTVTQNESNSSYQVTL
ncbi:uncharacterized protein PHACADRAFT_251869 [Phanerochaete carnosa HHB-10118-sp]|uniref:Uncharacterized protein n=1 Tax=Phanerochaete carnosa (strain HHB-10118-sp) TaxID=650164 RepID=K5W274_PHACS|nr:uncharacterized protein PHACADRAFT_251869 [Phanerochaete carnosa HHB-10118-sp]EKM57948.1 hypothetical protein PHACADRAFT_251869 [Phanerochaete carnosa HHB-10118-sp]